MTRNDIKVRMEQIQRIEAEAKKLTEALINKIDKEQHLTDMRLGSLKNAVELAKASCKDYKDVNYFMDTIEGYGVLEGMEEGEEKLSLPYIEIDKNYPLISELKMPINKAGDKLVVGISESDFSTYQANVIYETANQNTFDLLMAERKSGDLAEVHGLARDNEDIDLYVWDDITQEDYTYKYVVKKDDIDEVDRELEEDGYVLTE